MTLPNLPKTGQTGVNEWADVQDNDDHLASILNGNIENDNIDAAANITGTKLLNASVPDSKLASPNNSAYREVCRGGTALHSDASAGTYLLVPSIFYIGGAIQSTTPSASYQTTAGATGLVPMALTSLFYFDDADYSVGLTQKFRLRAQVLTNATQPVITFTFGLYPVTLSGTADSITLTPGTVVPSSAVAAASPTASTPNSYANTDFGIPGDGMYALGVVTSAQLTNNASVLLLAQLQHRSV